MHIWQQQKHLQYSMNHECWCVRFKFSDAHLFGHRRAWANRRSGYTRNRLWFSWFYHSIAEPNTGFTIGSFDRWIKSGMFGILMQLIRKTYEICLFNQKIFHDKKCYACSNYSCVHKKWQTKLAKNLRLCLLSNFSVFFFKFQVEWNRNE